jgi:hypothetical protein
LVDHQHEGSFRQDDDGDRARALPNAAHPGRQRPARRVMARVGASGWGVLVRARDDCFILVRSRFAHVEKPLLSESARRLRRNAVAQQTGSCKAQRLFNFYI